MTGTAGEVEVKDVLSAYLDAVTLFEPIQLRLWQQAGVTLTQRRVLHRLANGERGQSELARGLGLSAASLTRLIDRLEERGLVSRRRDQEDRRRVVVDLEPAGQQVIGQTAILRGSPVHRAIETMPAANRRRLLGALRALVATARALEDAPEAE
jgi:DNA-binding MarR family transcriptional regulator